ncbi:TIGR02444 family protein [Aureimonas fodinaquatilis]|uniref:TIGR02444 family protein n=1 Tax=Aureimonas fodinaquatilis TaxID=2565783 RepID=A0A5B0E1B7_9HYPH|nr:TIGR02444 family protein [Aureimonas fodinaquatilis]KAA0971570.1 TIGR02444 family protein [Aureimonas fodinaquatilis]
MQNGNDTELQLTGPIWRFAIEFYGKPGVSQACLKLQDEAGVDVVALIGILYSHTVLGITFDAAAVSQLRDVISPWRNSTVLPIRDLRRALKRPPEGFPVAETEQLRDLIKSAELKAEQIQLALIERWATSLPVHTGLRLEDALGQLMATAPDHQAGSFDVLISAAREVNLQTA